MKREELRIGNYIDNGGEPITVEFWMLDDLPYTLDGYKPIPLTEEWLKKFGFEKDGRYFMMGEHNDRFSGLMKIYRESFLEGDWILDIGQIEWITNFKYVHQLQNLYFALTGKEL